MDIRHLRQFTALAESGSLHRAARRLGLSQPALSQSIRTLEAELEVLLVKRSPSGTSLTPAGDAFLHEIKFLLKSLERAIHIAKIINKSSAPLRLGIAPGIMTQRLSSLIRRFLHNDPDNNLTSIDGTAAQLTSMLSKNFLDIIFVPIFGNEARSEQSKILWNEEIKIALSPSHPLASLTEIDLRQLDGIGLILNSDHNVDAAGQSLLEGCRSMKVRPTIIAITQHRDTQLGMAAAGLGIAATPAEGIGMEINSLTYRPTVPRLHIKIAAMWPASGLTAQAKRLIDQNPM